MKIGEVETEKFALEVWECECGFHIGIDISYLEQVGPLTVRCPACRALLSIE